MHTVARARRGDEVDDEWPDRARVGNVQEDIRKWLPGKFQFGTVLSVPEQTGIYQLGVGVIDPWKKKPAIRFANQLTLQSGWSILGQVEVGSN